MSDDTGFRRCDGFAGSIPQNFINANLPICPMCGNKDPHWLLKDKLEFSAHRILFRCSSCGCILSATQADFTGLTKSTAAAVLTTGGMVNAIQKKSAGKDVKTVYMKVEDTGNFQATQTLLNQELPLESFQQMARDLVAPAACAPVTEQSAPEQLAAAAAAAPAPQVQYVQPQVQYAQPAAPQVQYAQPVASQAAPAQTAAPLTARPSKLPMILAIVAASLLLINLLFGFTFWKFLSLSGAVLLLVDLVATGKKGNHLLFGIGTAAFSASYVGSLFVHYYGAARVVIAPTVLLYLGVIAFGVMLSLYYFLRGKVFGGKLKLIFTIVMAGCLALTAVIGFVRGIIYAMNGMQPIYIVRMLAGLLFSILGELSVVACILLHTPYKKEA